MQTQTEQASRQSTSSRSVSDLQHVPPALERYNRATLLGDLWKRSDLSPRDRSIVTPRGPDRAQSDFRSAVVPRLGTRPRSHASRDLRDHHSPRVLCRLGDCHGRRCCREGDLPRAWHRARSGSRRFTAATSAWSGRRAATCNARAAGRQASIPGARRLYDRPAVPGSVAPRGPRAAGSVGAPIWLLAALSILIGLGSALSVPT